MATKIDARPLLVLCAVSLAGCINFSPLDDLDATTPPADPFQAALYKNYSFLAKSFGQVGQAQYGSFDQDSSIPLTETQGTVADLANTYADKAMRLTRDEVVDPEPSRDIKTHDQRDRLVRALSTAKDVYPRDAARAQADWDCWRLNLRVASQVPSAEKCRQSFEITLARLETEAAAVAAEKAKEDEAKKKAAAEQGQKTAPGEITENP
ncbi:hypothetical protein [Rhizomicrobium electricum]|jgi:hypothetical protein|uniref:Lipoprotein n=1 Tax=Rhizomicrobium electricum TaxID=480070 RepID=A0ABN1EXC5_9PROT|nr:hypothetical protein [Rhizomicrobium electricum]NIJ49931.1 hypothetical protein [Rhizomicrobium electricum]